MLTRYLLPLILLAFVPFTTGFFGFLETDEPLNDEEKLFVGKWKGHSEIYEWEIQRYSNRTLRTVVIETYEGEVYRNYMTGNWEVVDGEYWYEYTSCEPADYDFRGWNSEIIRTLDKDKIVTFLPADEEYPEEYPEEVYTETPVSEFTYPEMQR